MGELGLRVWCLASTRAEDWEGEQDGRTTEAEEEEEINQDGKEAATDETGQRDNRDGGEETDQRYGKEVDSETLTPCEDRVTTPSQEADLEAEMESASSSASSSTSESDSTSTDSRAISELPDTPPEEQYLSCIQEAQLSPDETCIFTSSYDRTFNVYPLDPNIASGRKTQSLAPYASLKAANPIWAFAANPLFNFQDANTTHVLLSQRDSYITLHNALWDVSQSHASSNSPTTPVDISTPLSFYKNVNRLTEAVTAPLSLAYSHAGTHFFAGLQSSIATFDITHTAAPIHTIPTIPSLRNKLKGGGRGFKGCISALALSPPFSLHSHGLLAAGSRTRYIGLYDAGAGVETTFFALPGTLSAQRNLRNEKLAHVMGNGVSSLQWSPCGNYLYVAERCTDVLLLYDVRNYSLSLGYCVGRKAHTKQKLGFDVWSGGAAAQEVWAGGIDGYVRVWRDPCDKEGPVEADEVVRAGTGDMPVVGTLVHSSGGLAVAASGRIEVENGDEVGSTKGTRRGGGIRPAFREWGRLDLLGLGSGADNNTQSPWLL